jgi:hypothetical protein
MFMIAEDGSQITASYSDYLPYHVSLDQVGCLKISHVISTKYARLNLLIEEREVDEDISVQ